MSLETEVGNLVTQTTALVATVTNAAQVAAINLDVQAVTARKNLAIDTEIPAAIETLKAFTSKGAWTTNTAYAIKDLVSNGGDWYVCVMAHVSSPAFATDTGMKWRIYQGVTGPELAASSGASMMGYMPAGINAGIRTIENKLKDSVSVKDFEHLVIAGDWTTAIQAAIDAVSLAGGGTVYIPKGEYTHSGTIYLSRTMRGAYYNAISLIGDGRASGYGTWGNASDVHGGTLLNYTGTGKAIWVGDHVNDVTATNYNSNSFSVANLSVKLTANATHGFLFRGCYQLRLDNITVTGVSGGASQIGMGFQACVEGLYNLIDINFGSTAAGTTCIQVYQMFNLAGNAEVMGLASTSGTFLCGYFHYAHNGANVYGNSMTFQNCKWETLVNGVFESSGGFSNMYLSNYWENVSNYGVKVSSTDINNPAGNINIIGGFANRYDQAGSDMSGYTKDNAFLQLYNAKNVKMTGVQIIQQSVSMYSTVADLGGPNGTCENILIDADHGTLGRYQMRYTLEGGSGITGATAYTVAGSNSVLITKVGHGLIKGQVIDLVGFNSVALGLKVNRPYCVVSSVSDASNFFVLFPENATATAGSATGIIKYYNNGKLTNCGLPASVVFDDCVYKTYIFQMSMPNSGTNVSMLCNGSPSLIMPTDCYITSFNMSVDKPNINTVGTYVYILADDYVSNRYDNDLYVDSTSLDLVGARSNGSKLINKKFQANQAIRIKLFDSAGNGVTYPRNFAVEMVVADTLKAPLNVY